MANIATLIFEEQVRLDSDQLAKLYERMGETGAHEVVCRAMEELTVRLANISVSYQVNKTRELRKGAKGLIGIAEQIGMDRLAKVARDVCNCIDQNDPLALGATLARLQRIGDGSLVAVWDLQDLSV